MSSDGAPSPRVPGSTAWTGQELIVWGGQSITQARGQEPIFRLVGDGALYNPVTDSWRPMSQVGAPSARETPGVWTGSEILVWGGVIIPSFPLSAGPFIGGSPLQDGARYDPLTDAWQSMATSGAPSARSAHARAWTSTEMIVWGGIGGTGVWRNDGARYDPANDSWRRIPVPAEGAPSQGLGARAICTGTELFVWGGSVFSQSGMLGTRYDLASETWTPIQSDGTITATSRGFWTGTEFLLTGIVDTFTGAPAGQTFFMSFQPDTSTWRRLPPAPVPATPLVWTGEHLVAWGGQRDGRFANDGARYSPMSDTWEMLPSDGAPPPGNVYTAFNVGPDLVFLNRRRGAVLTNDPLGWVPIPTDGEPEADSVGLAEWTGSEVLMWGGTREPGTGVTHIGTGARLVIERAM